MARYSYTVVFWKHHEDPGTVCAAVPACRGCNDDGVDLAEARRDIAASLAFWLEVLRDDGEAFPEDVAVETRPGDPYEKTWGTVVAVETVTVTLD